MKTKKHRSKKARLRASLERDKRLKEVMKLRFIQCWTIEEIAQVLNVAPRTIERDVALIRSRLRKGSATNSEHELRDIADDLKLAREQKVKYLWNEFIRLEKLSTPDETRRARLSIIKQLTEIDNNLLDQLKKLGIITIPDENKSPTVNVGVQVGSSDSKDIEKLQTELDDSLAILSGSKNAPANRL